MTVKDRVWRRQHSTAVGAAVTAILDIDFRRYGFPMIVLRMALSVCLPFVQGCGEGYPEPAHSQNVARATVAPAHLATSLKRIASDFDGDIGIAVIDLETGWLAEAQGDRRYPQQSVVKLWVALAVLDAVDRGALRLEDRIVVRPSDMSIFHQPLADRVTPAGLEIEVGELVRLTAVDSDNAANDVLVRLLGGAGAVQATLDRKGLRDIRVDREERVMQAELQGLLWDPRYADPTNFETARAALPAAVRTAALERYLTDPRDTATPTGTARALAALARGDLLTPRSTRLLLRHMSDVTRAADRLKAGIPANWSIAHRPGTGPTWQNRGIAMNDIGILSAPNGRRFAVAVFIAQSPLAQEQRAAVIAAVARVVAHSKESDR